MTEEKKAPDLRFPGFTDPWEQRKLSEVTTEFKSGEGIKADEIDENGTYPVYGGNGLRGYTERYNHDGEYALIGRQGALCGNMNYSVGKAYFTEHAVAVKANESNDTRFLYYLLDRMDLGRYSDQSAQPGLAVNKLVVLHTYVPRKQEQEAIGVYFKSLDSLITLHQRKVDDLKTMKKCLLQQMFPKEGENTPELRFPGFTDPWEQRKVSDLFRVTRGYVLAATQTEATKTDEKPYPVYSSQTKDNGLMGYYKDYLYEDAITWTTDGANAGTVNYRAGKFYCTNVCGVLLSNEVKANQMIAEALNNVAKGYVSYVGNPKLMNNVMADIVIQIPTQAEEREQLSTLFASLDHLITLHQRKVDDLKTMKKCLLQKMFI